MAVVAQHRRIISEAVSEVQVTEVKHSHPWAYRKEVLTGNPSRKVGQVPGSQGLCSLCLALLPMSNSRLPLKRHARQLQNHRASWSKALLSGLCLSSGGNPQLE